MIIFTLIELCIFTGIAMSICVWFYQIGVHKMCVKTSDYIMLLLPYLLASVGIVSCIVQAVLIMNGERS